MLVKKQVSRIVMGMGTGTSLNNQTTFFPLFASVRKEFLQKISKKTKAEEKRFAPFLLPDSEIYIMSRNSLFLDPFFYTTQNVNPWYKFQNNRAPEVN